MTGSSSLLRIRRAHEHGRVTFVELFFDLVFVFAVTQLSHSLLEHLSFIGAVHTVLLLFAVWWVWIYTAWVTNWLDPERTSVRLMMFALMLAGLVLSASIPEAFDEQGLPFACAYVLMQVGRSVFMMGALRKHDAVNHRNFQRIVVWFLLSGVFWIWGGVSEHEQRLVLWIVALLVEYLGPMLYFWVPGLGRSHTTEWNVDGAHIAERCASSSRSVNRYSSPARPPRNCRSRRRTPRAFSRRSSAASRCGGCISTSARSATATASPRPTIPDDSRAWCTPTFTC